jgi:hypothetical protein
MARMKRAEHLGDLSGTIMFILSNLRVSAVRGMPAGGFAMPPDDVNSSDSTFEPNRP